MNLSSAWSKYILRLLVQQGPIPKHVGFIMDGNRRYGKEHKMSLEKAYQTGAQTLETILEFCFATGIQAVTVYAFSLANLQRSAEEVKAVMAHLKVCLARFLQDGGVAERFGVRLRLCGDRSLLPTETLEGLEHAERILGKNTKHVLNLCLAYGSRHEITSSVKAAVVKHSRRLCIAGQLDSPSQPGMTGHGLPLPRHDIIETLEDTMSTAGCPPLDFLIRTSGTRRLSDFMLWQCHETTDIVILKKNWPELLYWDFMQVFGQWQLRAPRAKCIDPVIETPDVLHVLVGWLYLVFELFLRASNAVRGYSRAISKGLDCRLHSEEVSLRIIQKDAGKLKKIPAHLSVILNLTDGPNALNIAMSTVADIVSWCSCIGIPFLSVYEKTGTLKANKISIHEIVATRLPLYYGTQRHTFNLTGTRHSKCSLLLLSAQDGRNSLADICNDLAGLVAQGKISPDEIDTMQVEKMLQTILVASLDDSSRPKDKRLTADSYKGSLSCKDTLSQRLLNPDILFVFGSRIQFEGYPPWQLASTEIFCTGEDITCFARRGSSARYRVFLQGLQRFAGADIKLGK